MAAGLCPDPLGELKRSPRPLATIRGYSKERGTEGREREGRGRREKGRGGGNLLQGLRGYRRPWCVCSIYVVLIPQNCHFPLTCCVALTTVYGLPCDTVIQYWKAF